MKNIFRKIIVGSYYLLSLSFYKQALAAMGEGSDPTVSLGLDNPIKAGSLVELLEQIIEVSMYIAIPIIVLAIIYAGFLFIKAQGNPGEIEKAKQTLWYVIIGTAIILGARLLIEVVQGTIGGIQNPSVDL